MKEHLADRLDTHLRALLRRTRVLSEPFHRHFYASNRTLISCTCVKVTDKKNPREGGGTVGFGCVSRSRPSPLRLRVAAPARSGKSKVLLVLTSLQMFTA
jgi:hypothetical protein